MAILSRDYLTQAYGKWGKELGRFFSAQIFITVTNMVGGLMILRFLAKDQYALYTVGFATLTLFTSISNSGVAPIVNALAGKHWQDRLRMGSIINTAIGFRKQVGLALAAPVGIYMVWQYYILDAGWGTGLLLTLTFGIIGLIIIETSVLGIPLLFAKQISTIQRVDVQSSLTKLGWITVAGLIYPTTFTIALGSMAGAAWKWVVFRDKVPTYADLAADADPKTRQSIWSLFKLNAPGTLYWSFQGQITILLCSLFATTENVAEIGALGRLTVIFGILNSFVAAYLTPEISKAKSVGRIVKVSSLVIGIFVVATGVLLLGAWWRPDWILLVLGDKYQNLQEVLLLSVSISMISVFQSQISSMCGSRGWVKWFALYIPVTLVAQVVGVLVFQLNSVRSILYFNGLVASASLLMSIGIYMYEILKYRAALAFESRGEIA